MNTTEADVATVILNENDNVELSDNNGRIKKYVLTKQINQLKEEINAHEFVKISSSDISSIQSLMEKAIMYGYKYRTKQLKQPTKRQQQQQQSKLQKRLSNFRKENFETESLSDLSPFGEDTVFSKTESQSNFHSIVQVEEETGQKKIIQDDKAKLRNEDSSKTSSSMTKTTDESKKTTTLTEVTDIYVVTQSVEKEKSLLTGKKTTGNGSNSSRNRICGLRCFSCTRRSDTMTSLDKV